MANMHYCRFQNTHNDLLDCLDALNDEEELTENLDEYMSTIPSEGM